MAQTRDAAAVAIRSNTATTSPLRSNKPSNVYMICVSLSISGLCISLAGASTGALPVSDRVRAALRRQDERPLVDENIKALARDWFTRLQIDALAMIGGVSD